MCKLSVQCTAAACDEQVSYTDTFVKYGPIKGLVDSEIREELLSQTPELNLEQSLAFIPGMFSNGHETVKRLLVSGL